MSGLTVKLNTAAALPGQPFHDRQRKVFTFEHWPLLDVKFKVRCTVRRKLCFDQTRLLLGIMRNSFRYRYTFVVYALQQFARQFSHDCATAQKWRTKTRALLIRKSDHLDGEWILSIPTRLDQRQPHHHAEHPVISAGIRYRVQMRSEQQSGQMIIAARWIHPTEIACPIDSDRHPRCFHPGPYSLMDLAHCGRQKGPQDLTRPLGTLRQLSAAPHHDRCVPTGRRGTRLFASCYGQPALLTVASIEPCGSSVGTKIWFGLSSPSGDRSTRLQCLFGIDK